MVRLTFVVAAILPAIAFVPAVLVAQNHTIVFPNPHIKVPHDAAARAAIACGEPPLQVILARQGYTINEEHGEIAAQLFVKAGRGPIIFKPIAAYGLADVSMGGWYKVQSAIGNATTEPVRQTMWRLEPYNNKQPYPPVMRGSTEKYNPGNSLFGLWVSSTGFKNERVYTQDVLQKFVRRFGNDLHKAHVYVAVRNGQIVPNTYLIGWEYSTNDDNQDMVTMVSNVKPVNGPK